MNRRDGMSREKEKLMNMDTALAVAAEAEAGADIELVALAPSDLLAAQTNLVLWCDGKVTAIRRELKDLRENLKIAKDNKWRTSGLASAAMRSEKRIGFYEKIKLAVAAGYLIVPNFPVDIFAVRTTRAKPAHTTSEYASSSAFNAKPQSLPAGEGRYVDDRCFTKDESYDKTLPDGKMKHVARHVIDSFDDVDFPVQAVKPVVLDATQRAMALKIFDQMGMVQNRSGKDPIVVGQLIDPRGNGRMVTFFVAWWLNTSDL